MNNMQLSLYFTKHFNPINAELQMSCVNSTKIHTISVISQPISTLDHWLGSSHRDDSSQGPNTEILDLEILNPSGEFINVHQRIDTKSGGLSPFDHGNKL